MAVVGRVSSETIYFSGVAEAKEVDELDDDELN
jgi:hypothetical protein